MSSLFQILPKESILKVLENVFPSMHSIFCRFFPFYFQFPDSKCKAKRGIFIHALQMSYMGWLFWAIYQIKKTYGASWPQPTLGHFQRNSLTNHCIFCKVDLKYTRSLETSQLFYRNPNDIWVKIVTK